MNLMGIRGCEHGALSCPWTVEYQTAPSFFYESFRECVAFFFPIVDAPPVHDEGRRRCFRQAEMANDLSAMKGDGNAFERNIKIARRREMHLACFQICTLFTGSAWKRVSADAVITVGFEVGLFRFIVPAGGFCNTGRLFPTLSQPVPCRSPSFPVEATQP